MYSVYFIFPFKKGGKKWTKSPAGGYGKLVGMYCFWHDTQMQMYVEKSLSVNLKE